MCSEHAENGQAIMSTGHVKHCCIAHSGIVKHTTGLVEFKSDLLNNTACEEKPELLACINITCHW